MHIVGVDVGGTFTDVVLTDTRTGHTTTHKVPSTPKDPATAVLRGIQEICQREGITPAALQHVLHGTTVATNAVIEHKGVAAGLITTEGFRDIIHIVAISGPNIIRSCRIFPGKLSRSCRVGRGLPLLKG